MLQPSILSGPIRPIIVSRVVHDCGCKSIAYREWVHVYPLPTRETPHVRHNIIFVNDVHGIICEWSSVLLSKMLVCVLWLVLYSLSPTVFSLSLPGPDAIVSSPFLNQTTSANLRWPFILPYTWEDRDTGMYYKLGFSVRRVSLNRKSNPSSSSSASSAAPCTPYFLDPHSSRSLDFLLFVEASIYSTAPQLSC